MLDRLPRTQRNVALVVLAALVLWFAWSIRSVVNPLLVGYLLAYILHPLVRWFERRGLSRRASVNLIFVGGFLLLGGVTLGLVVELRDLALTLVEEAQDENFRGKIEAFNEKLRAWFGEDWALEGEVDLSQLRELAQRFLGEHGEQVSAAAGAGFRAAGRSLDVVAGFAGGVVAVAGLFVLVPLYTYYFLFVLGRVHGFVKDYLPRGDRARLAKVATDIGEVLASFFRGRLLVCLVKGLLLWIGLWIAGIQHAFLFGMLSGFLSLIPFFGPFLGFLVAAAVGILDHGVLGSLLRTGAVFAVMELVEGYVLIPYVLGDSLGLHPLVVLFAMLAGGASLGMFGILIALPLTASLVILFKEFVKPAILALAEESGGEPRGDPGSGSAGPTPPA